MAIQFFNTATAFVIRCLMKIICAVLNFSFNYVFSRFDFTLTEDDKEQALILDIAVYK